MIRAADAGAREGHVMRDWGTGVHWWGWLLGFAVTAIFVGLVIWAIVALVSWAHHDGNGPSGGGGPEPPRGAGPRQRDSHPQASARRDEAQASTRARTRAGYARRPGARAGYAHRYRDAGYARHYAAAGRN